MPQFTLNPAANESPDTGQGGLAVTTASNTGHANTTSTASGGTNSQTKTCRWASFPAGPSSPISVTLKVGFTRNGTLSDGGVLTSNQFKIEYSVNGGGAWLTLRDNSNVTSSASGTDSVALSAAQDTTQVQVRDTLIATKEEATTATLAATVSDIRLEIQVGDDAEIAPIVII